MSRSGMALVELSITTTLFWTDRLNRKALTAIHARTSAQPITQPRGVNQITIAATKATVIVIRRKNEKKRPRVTSCPSRLGCRHLGNLEAIPSTAHGFKIARRLGVSLDLFANPANVNVDRARGDKASVAPHGVQQMVAAEDPARMAGQIVQKAELGGRRRDQLAVHPELHRAGVDFNVFELDDGRRSWPLEAPQDSLDASYQLARREGLGDVVVGAHLQAMHAVVLCSARGQKDDGHDTQGGVLAQPPAKVETIAAGHHDIQQKERGR